MSRAEEILTFWFGDDPENPYQNASRWWKKDPDFDREILDKFGVDLKKAISGEYHHWRDNSRTGLALIILTDQFSRNIFRDTPQSFAQDSFALTICLDLMERGLDQELTYCHRAFLYMPLMHSEDRKVQEISLKTYQKLAETCPEKWREKILGNFNFARQHADIIFRFGRYPHRNKILKRPSTPEEESFLTQPGSSF